ncbi:nuclear pore protein 84/107 [Obelidium mucronatum]|nr:nuclear pore protein 84/107 [Obelidium mucronatum]
MNQEPHMIVTSTGEHFLVTAEFDAFAKELFENGASSALDDEPILGKYSDICATRFNELSGDEEATEATKELAAALQLEGNTWDLVYRLLDLRVPAADDEENSSVPCAYSSDQAIVSYVVKKDKSLAENIAIKDWLEKTAAGFNPAEVRKAYRDSTQKSLRDRSSRGMAMDPDGPIRTGIPLHPDDNNYEQALNKTLFSCIRRGEISKALEFCHSAKEPWKAASLSGAAYFRDAFLDGDESNDEDRSGNINRDMWKETAYAIAREPTFDQYERALYGVFAGSVDFVTPVCKTWEDFVWAHYSSYIESVLDKHLATVPQLSRPDEEFTKTPLQETVKLPSELFEWLSLSETPDLRNASMNPFRIIQAMLILDRIDPLLMSIHRQLCSQDAQGMPQLPTVLRFMVHLILALRSVSYPIEAKESADFIIKTFIDMLIAARKTEIVAIYCGQLPASLQIECFAQFLEGLTVDKDMRYQYILQGKDCGIDMQMACKRTVELTFSTGIFLDVIPAKASSVFVSNMDAPISDSLFKQLRALEWLLFDPLQQADALIQCNRLIRRCLVHGQIHLVKQILAIVPEKKDFLKKSWLKNALNEASLIDAKDHAALEKLNPLTRRTAAGSFEFMSYTSLVKCFEGLVQWTEFLGRRPMRSSGESDGIANYQFRDWSETMKTGTDRTEKVLRDCLEDIKQLPLNDGGFSGVEGKERMLELQMIRDIYATEVILRLQHILFETQEYMPGNIAKSLSLLSEFVEDGTETFHKEFVRSGKVVFFMQKYNQAKALAENNS